MLTSPTLNLLNFLFGFMVGVYLRLAGLYLFHFFRKTHFGFRVMFLASFRLFLLVLGFLLVLAALGISLDVLKGPEQPAANHDLWLGLGVIVAFFLGTILFLVGLWRAWKGRAQAG